MKPNEIKQAIAEQGYTLSMIAEVLEVNLSNVSGVVCGHTQSKRVADFIAKIIDKPTEEVFPNVTSYARPKVLRGMARQQGIAQLQQLLAS
ncbi:helix-turn-helix domain-containing protein [Pseudoalteromonas byunsanensis]|uniref:HTH cro/C1-type domain-containing protein n=1 Tax=Pseudoalteromonas byunsanensis TaxID=327939 RepID=A0A1S1NCJ2_9GAMM|nr:helix-turn-helix domain-containing protein [Pseudoalteromonas byunsanensis]OHU97166.1 hypothetical protein BIW53_02270 [Pseudoalteromonas byunsanensis]